MLCHNAPITGARVFAGFEEKRENMISYYWKQGFVNDFEAPSL